jgi:hypothetical protein
MKTSVGSSIQRLNWVNVYKQVPCQPWCAGAHGAMLQKELAKGKALTVREC